MRLSRQPGMSRGRRASRRSEAYTRRRTREPGHACLRWWRMEKTDGRPLPGGEWTSRARPTAREAGVVGARTIRGGPSALLSDQRRRTRSGSPRRPREMLAYTSSRARVSVNRSTSTRTTTLVAQTPPNAGGWSDARRLGFPRTDVAGPDGVRRDTAPNGRSLPAVDGFDSCRRAVAREAIRIATKVGGTSDQESLNGTCQW